jgi:hypothetical protein
MPPLRQKGRQLLIDFSFDALLVEPKHIQINADNEPQVTAKLATQIAIIPLLRWHFASPEGVESPFHDARDE